MLDRAGNANGDIQVRRNDFTRLADLIIIWHIPGINGRARRTRGRTQFIRNRDDIFFVVFTTAQTTTARNNDFCRLQVRTLGFSQFLPNER